MSSKKRKDDSLKTSSKSLKQQKGDSRSDLLSRYLLEDEFKTKFAKAFSFLFAFLENECFIHTAPFKCCFLPNFISDEEFLKRLEKDLLQLKFFEKSNDLYKFQQSDDLKKSSKTNIAALRNVLYNDFRTWLHEMTGFTDLTDQVDMSCAKYGHTDVLLCHDDELEGRRIAYIFYLVPPDWEDKDGGTLDLFCIDEHGQPGQITTSLVPQRNSLVFFEVTPVSFHQVSEVLSLNKTRLSISGWFHGDNIDRPVPYQEPHPKSLKPYALEDDVLVDWINPMYLDTGVVKDIRARFKDESEIQLQEFLLENKYQEVLEALRNENLKWTWQGPANKRHFEQVATESAPSIVQQLTKLLQSQPIFKLLRTMTGLDMADVPLSDDDDDDDDDSDDDDDEGSKDTDKKKGNASERGPCCHGSIRRWAHGCYTLVHDTDPEGAEFALDVMLYVGGSGWKSDYGGYTTYLTSGEDEELLTVHPQENSMALVYRDKETVRFVKHINHSVLTDVGTADKDNNFFDFSFVYFE
ncbi:prolyl 3-hydroxylase OGFOD1-like isoform X2 [Oculina patagonica]